MQTNGIPSSAEITETIYDCILRVKLDLDRSCLRPDVGFDDLGLSSIETITVIFEIEETFDIVLVDPGSTTSRTYPAPRSFQRARRKEAAPMTPASPTAPIAWS